MQLRNSTMEIGQVYFYTATINQWKHLLSDHFKQVIMDSLLFLQRQNLIDVFGYVFMPSHIHMLWKLNAMNGREKPNASLLKFTAHAFRKQIDSTPFSLHDFAVQAPNKQYEFWQRDSLAVPVFSRFVAEQKLRYIHLNPQRKGWSLCSTPDEYRYSSAAFYRRGVDEFGLVRHLDGVF